MNLTRHLIGATAGDTREALATYNAFRATLGHGKVSRGRALMGAPGDNAKTAKTVRPVYTLSLAPHRDVAMLADVVPAVADLTVCPWSTPACRAACVSYAGNGEYPRTQRLRAVKTAFAVAERDAFVTLLMDDIAHAAERDPDAAMRLNTFSDVAWERVLPADAFAMLAAYDYTKGGIRRYRAARAAGYRLTLSVSERTSLDAMDAWLAEGATAAVIFPTLRGHELPRTFRGHEVVDGDKSDDRLADPDGVVVGLRAKGRLNYGRNTEHRVFVRGTAA